MDHPIYKAVCCNHGDGFIFYLWQISFSKSLSMRSTFLTSAEGSFPFAHSINFNSFYWALPSSLSSWFKLSLFLDGFFFQPPPTLFHCFLSPTLHPKFMPLFYTSTSANFMISTIQPDRFFPRIFQKLLKFPKVNLHFLVCHTQASVNCLLLSSLDSLWTILLICRLTSLCLLLTILSPSFLVLTCCIASLCFGCTATSLDDALLPDTPSILHQSSHTWKPSFHLSRPSIRIDSRITMLTSGFLDMGIFPSAKLNHYTWWIDLWHFWGQKLCFSSLIFRSSLAHSRH